MNHAGHVAHAVMLVSSIGAAAGVAGCAGDAASADDGGYVERDDAANNSNVGGTPEHTGLVYDATGSITVHGQVNAGHLDTEDLDYDAYTFTVAVATYGGMVLGGADASAALALFDVAIINGDSSSLGRATVDHAVGFELPAGAYTLEVRAQNSTPIASSFPYTIEISHMVVD